MLKKLYFLLLFCFVSSLGICQVQYNNITPQTIPPSYIANGNIVGTGIQYQIQNNTLQFTFQGTFSQNTLKLGEVYYLQTSPLLPNIILGNMGNNNYKAEIRNNFLYISSNTEPLTIISGFGNSSPSQSVIFTKNLSLPQFDLPTSVQNYVKTTSVLVEGQTNSTQIAGLQVGQKMEQITYFDGLGREIQTVSLAQSPQLRDIVQPIVYDEFGRQTKKHLPYTISGNNGAYRNNAIGEATAFYQNTPNVAQTNFPFSETILENSPNSTPLMSGNVGESWQIIRNEVGLPMDIMDNRSTKAKSRALNTDETVWRWDMSMVMVDFPVKNSQDYAYNATEDSPLWVEEVQDEHHNKTLIYKDKYGQVLLKKAQKNGSEFIQTYYIYDDFGQLRYVLPPLAVEKLAQNGFLFDDEVKELIFYYQYDYKRRVIVKKVPNAGETHIVYDQLDRVIMTQDAEQRLKSQWIVTKYDILGRTALTLMFSPESSSYYAVMGMGQLQELANNHIGRLYETRDSPYAIHRQKTKYWTTDLSFPKVDCSDACDILVLTASYYDDYDFNNDGNPDIEYNQTIAQIKGCEGIPFLSNRLKPTGSYVRLLQDYASEEEAKYILTATFYDDRGRVIQSLTESHISGGYDIVSNKYDFSGKLLKTHHYQQAGTGINVIVQTTQRTEYDHAGRAMHQYHQINEAKEVLLSSNQYNELSQVIQKSLGKISSYSPYLQTITYDYNIRGWLTHINKGYLGIAGNVPTQTLFGMELVYENPYLRYVDGLPVPTTPNYNGNITAQRWKSSLSPDRVRSYYYQYDGLNRLTNATYTAIDAQNQPKEQDWFNEKLTYDNNGNIKTLKRTGLQSKNGTQMTFGLVDDFTYQYQGNQLLNIVNAVNTPTLHTGNEYNYMVGSPPDNYIYNENGSLLQDPRKSIDVIGYNHLNLPTFVCDTSGEKNYIINLYDAVGLKLRKRTLENGKLKVQYDYISGNVYKDNVLEFVPTSEGRIIFENNKPVYEYHYKDHLGNLRVAFREAQSEKWVVGAELANQSQEETQFANVNQTRANKPQYLGEKACETSQQKPLGWWKSIPVQKGDVIFATCDAFFERNTQNTNTGINWNAFLFLNPNYALNNGENMMTPNNNLVGIGILPTFGGNNAEIPKAYLIAQFYNADNQPTQQRKVLYVTSANYAWANLGEIQEIALENGRVEIFVANESNTKVYFDDLGIYKSPTPIVQENHYYPFGMNLVGIEKEGTPNHRFQFMGKEKESSFGLNWTETDWRGYDGQIGRFWQVDKLTEQAPDWTGYRYGFNNPVSHTDPSGLFEEINLGKGKGVDKNLELYLKELENSGILGHRKGGTKAPDPPTRKLKTVNVTGKKWTKKDERQYQRELKNNQRHESIKGAIREIAGELTGLNDLRDAISSFGNGQYMAGIFSLGMILPWGKFGKAGKFLKSSDDELITIYRGVNSSADVAYENAKQGIVKPRGSWLFGHSDPFLHNHGLNGTLNSRFTSWTTDEDVALNFAFRRNGEGVLLEMTIPKRLLYQSPDIHKVRLKHKPGIEVGEQEVLLKGTFRNIKNTKVNIDN